MSDKYVINGYELDAEDFNEDPTEIIDGQAEGDKIYEIAKDAAPLGNAILSFPWQRPYCASISSATYLCISY